MGTPEHAGGQAGSTGPQETHGLCSVSWAVFPGSPEAPQRSLLAETPALATRAIAGTLQRQLAQEQGPP